jgi:hypothetical protein
VLASSGKRMGAQALWIVSTVLRHGEMAERIIALAPKASRCSSLAGSNPALAALDALADWRRHPA